LKTVKSQYLSNGLATRPEIWHDDDNGPMNFTLLTHTLHLLLYAIKPQNYENKKNWLQVLLFVKAASLNSKYQNFIRQF